MTDKEFFIDMLKRAGILFLDENYKTSGYDRVADELGEVPHSYINLSQYIVNEKPKPPNEIVYNKKITGYGDFFGEFFFREDGSLIGAGFWE